jgi:Trypsin-co-occurring domain 1
MSKAIAVQIEGQTFLVETDESVDIPVVHVPEVVSERRLPEDVQEVVSIDDVKRNLAEVKDVIIACCNNLHSAVANIPAPQRFAIEFGVKLAGEKGIPFLTKASGEATFKVTVEWKKE